MVRAADDASLSSLEASIGDQCDTITWTTTGIFTLSIFLTILRPDPTLTICLFGFYGITRFQAMPMAPSVVSDDRWLLFVRVPGAHTRSKGAIRSFVFFILMSIVVDLLWLFVYSPLRPIAFGTLLSLSRKDQARAQPASVPSASSSCMRRRVHTRLSLSVCARLRDHTSAALMETMGGRGADIAAALRTQLGVQDDGRVDRRQGAVPLHATRVAH